MMSARNTIIMKIQKEFDLYPRNTMRLHSVAELIYTPEDKDELDSLIRDFQKKNQSFALLSAGSNIVFADRVSTPLIDMMSLDNRIQYLENGDVYVGASVRVQALIRDLQRHQLGGIEYLFSVPSSVGGALYMNAGRGKSIGVAISDYLKKVYYYDISNNKYCWYEKKSSDFSHRHSPFQDAPTIILGAVFCFKSQDDTETEKLIKGRMEHSKKYLSADKPSCGSVYCKGNPIIYRLLMGRKRGGAMFSKKTPNWISNLGNASSEDVLYLIRLGQRIHQLFFSKCEVEIRYVC